MNQRAHHNSQYKNTIPINAVSPQFSERGGEQIYNKKTETLSYFTSNVYFSKTPIQCYPSTFFIFVKACARRIHTKSREFNISLYEIYIPSHVEMLINHGKIFAPIYNFCEKKFGKLMKMAK